MKFPFTRKLTDQRAPQPSVASEQPRPRSAADMASEFRSLWTASQFFIVLQKLQLQPERGRAVDLSDLGRRIEEARQARRSAGVAKLAELQRDLGQARAEVYELDTTIPVSIMRRFFERLGRFDRAALGEVVRYYMHKAQKTPDDRDKLDLLITRYGSYRIETQAEYATWRSVDGLAEQLAKLRSEPEDLPASTRERTVDDLREMRSVVFDIRTFADLIERKVVSRLRDYKISLGENFYFPSVLAEVAEINVAVHNKFQELYHTEMVRLQLEAERLSRIQEDAGRLLPGLNSHRALSELAAMTVTMQQLLQEVKKDVAERVIVDRNVRVSVEERGVPLRTMVESCEDALRQTAELVKALHEAYQKAEARK